LEQLVSVAMPAWHSPRADTAAFFWPATTGHDGRSPVPRGPESGPGRLDL